MRELEAGDYVWRKNERQRTAIWQIVKVRTCGAQYPNSPLQIICKLVHTLDPSCIFIPRPGRRRVVEPRQVERVPGMMVIALAALE